MAPLFPTLYGKNRKSRTALGFPKTKVDKNPSKARSALGFDKSETPPAPASSQVKLFDDGSSSAPIEDVERSPLGTSLADLVPQVLSGKLEQDRVKESLGIYKRPADVDTSTRDKFEIGAILPVVGLQRFTELQAGATPSEIESVVRDAIGGDLEATIRLLGQQRVNEIGVDGIPDASKQLGTAVVNVIPGLPPPDYDTPYIDPPVVPAPDWLIPDDPRYEGNTPGYDYNRFIQGLPNPPAGEAAPYPVGVVASIAGSTEDNTPFQTTGTQLPGTRFFSEIVPNAWLGILAPTASMPEGSYRMEEPYMSRREADRAFQDWKFGIKIFQSGREESPTDYDLGLTDDPDAPDYDPILHPGDDPDDTTTPGENPYQELMDQFPGSDSIISPGTVIHKEPGTELDSPEDIAAQGGISLSQRRDQANSINENMPGLQQPEDFGYDEDLIAAIRFAAGAFNGNPFLSINGLARMRRGLLPLFNQFDPQFFKRTQPNIINALKGLYKAVGLEDDFNFFQTQVAPPALR